MKVYEVKSGKKDGVQVRWAEFTNRDLALKFIDKNYRWLTHDEKTDEWYDSVRKEQGIDCGIVWIEEVEVDG